MRVADGVAETCTVSGSGVVTLTGAVSDAHKRFRDKYTDGKTGLGIVLKTTQASPNGAKVEAAILSTLTYVAGTPIPPDTLSRGTTIRSSNGGAAVSWLSSDIVICYQAPLLDIIRMTQPDYLAGPPSFAVGDIMTYWGNVLEYDVTSAPAALSITSAGALFGHGFQFDVYPYGSTSNSLVITPPSGQAFSGQAPNATLSILGETRKTIAWNDARSKWMVR